MWHSEFFAWSMAKRKSASNHSRPLNKEIHWFCRFVSAKCCFSSQSAVGWQTPWWTDAHISSGSVDTKHLLTAPHSEVFNGSLRKYLIYFWVRSSACTISRRAHHYVNCNSLDSFIFIARKMFDVVPLQRPTMFAARVLPKTAAARNAWFEIGLRSFCHSHQIINLKLQAEVWDLHNAFVLSMFNCEFL